MLNTDQKEFHDSMVYRKVSNRMAGRVDNGMGGCKKIYQNMAEGGSIGHFMVLILVTIETILLMRKL